MIPATAGKAIKEEELRAYIRCSQLFHYGGTFQPSTETMMAQHSTEYWMAQVMRTPEKSTSYLLTRAVASASARQQLYQKLLEGQVQQLQNGTFLWMDEFLKLFKPDMYIPVSGPIPWRVQVSDTAIDLLLSGIFRTVKNKTLHLISFTPYKDRHSQINDPVTHLKLQVLRTMVRKDPRRPQAVLHLLWAKENGRLGYDSVNSSELNPEYIDLIQAKVQEMERGTHFPVLPCRFACPFKTKCFPGAAP